MKARSIKVYLVKGKMLKRLDTTLSAKLIMRYTVVGHTFNQYGQVLYLPSLFGKRIHSLLFSDEEL